MSSSRYKRSVFSLFSIFDLPKDRRGRPARRKELLTDDLISLLPATQPETSIYDLEVEGLFVRVRSTGLKTFNYRSRGARSKKSVKLGAFPQMGVFEARRAAQARANSWRRGISHEAQSSKHSPGSLAYAFHQYMSQSASPPQNSEWRTRVLREFERVVLPKLGDQKLASITDVTWNNLCQSRAGFYGERNLRNAFSPFLTWAVQTGRLERNPLKGFLRGPAPFPKRIHLDQSDLVQIWNACEKLPHKWCVAYRIVMATGLPIRSVLALKANSKMKNGYVDFESEGASFGPLALQLLETIDTDSAYLFCAAGKHTPMAFQQGILNDLREAAFVGNFRMQDLLAGVLRLLGTRKHWQLEWNDFSPSSMHRSDDDDAIEL